MNVSPVILFTFKRPEHTRITLDALANNALAESTILYIYCDGPKETASKIDLENINKTREIAEKETRFKEVIVIKKEKNQGLANSIVSGVSEVVKKHGKAIIIEDDIITAPSCLTFFNKALEMYKEDESVFSISAYRPPSGKTPETDSFFLPFSFPWGWAVWKRSWDKFVPDSILLKKQIDKRGLQKQLNFSYYPYYQMLQNDIEGKVSSWFVRFYAHHLLNNGLCLYPGISLTKNIGFDSTGEHCNTEDDYFSKVPFGDIYDISRKELKVDPIIWKKYKQEFRDREPNPNIWFKVVRKLRRIFKNINLK